MTRTKLTLGKGERGGEKRVLRSRTVRMILAEKGRRPPLQFTPSPAKEAPPRGEEIERQVEGAEQLEGVGQSPLLLPTQQLVQMAAEARPSKLGREEPAHKKL